MKGFATKAEYAAALRGYQSATEEMSSPDRDEAKAFDEAKALGLKSLQEQKEMGIR